VNQCKQCGANLPENARFCLQCGTAVESEPAGPPTPLPDLDFVQPALMGGAFLGLMSSLPIIMAGNCLCCMWVIGGGAIGTVLLQKQQPSRTLTSGDGAFVGVLSGLFGAIVGTIVSIPVRIISTRIFGSQQEAIEKMFEGLPEIEGPMRDLVMRIASSEISVVTVIATFITNLIFWSLFAMVGGILAVVILNKRRNAN
jgi:hypothetical protein